MSYPAVKLPEKFREIAKSTPPIPQEPYAPTKPSVFKKPEPDYQEEWKSLVSHLWAFLALLVCLPLMLAATNSDWLIVRLISLPLGVLSFILFIFSTFIFEKLKSYSKKKTSYEDGLRKMIKHHKEYPELYTVSLLPRYEAAHATWRSNCQKYASEAEIVKHKQKLISDVFAAQKKPLIHKNHARIRKGASEEYIANLLANRFVGKVHTNATLAPDSFANTAKGPLPDILIHDSNLGYSFVIEVDEPYELQYGQPIHCIGEDDERDNYFLNENWGVIRLAEVQFMTEPELCCDFIAYTINNATFGLAQLPTNGRELALSKVPRWNEEQARQMERDDFRATYLPNEVIRSSVIGSGTILRRRRREELEARIKAEDMPF